MPRDALARCQRCPRLADHLASCRRARPDHHNRPVPGRGSSRARLVVVGLAPGARGANRTGRTFDGDPSGDVLQRVLHRVGLLPDLPRARVTNAVKCLPPGNLPTGTELRTCSSTWLARELRAARAVLALGHHAHRGVLAALDLPPRAARFAHLAEHALGHRLLVDCYHPSPLNTNTGRLSEDDLQRAILRAVHHADPGFDPQI